MRGIYNGILTLVSSVNRPVFGLPAKINFINMPKVGDSFVFEHPQDGLCVTSEVKSDAVDSETGERLIQTRNSIFKLKLTEN